MHGQFVWYELTTPDVDAAKTFYPRFTGWGTLRFDNDYTMWTTGGVPVAGIFRLTEEMRRQGVPPNWMPYVESDNLDETAKKAAALGGKVIVAPQDIPGTGRFAVLQDPQGATFGVYKASTGSGGWDGTAVVGHFSWHELMTTDYVKAFEFYRALFGWEKTSEMDMGGGNMYSMFGKGAPYGGMFNRTPDMAGMHPFWLVYINVKDVGKAVAIATKAGAMVQRPQMDIPGGSIAILGDPQGAGFALHHVTAQVLPAKPAAKTTAKSGATKAAKAAPKKGASASLRAKAKGTPKPARKVKAKVKAKARPKARSSARKVVGRGSASKARRVGKAKARKK
jgi:hypothetical protein